jgi:hypothetical protein
MAVHEVAAVRGNQDNQESGHPRQFLRRRMNGITKARRAYSQKMASRDSRRSLALFTNGS